MNLTVGAIEKPSNGLGVVAVLCGVAGAAVTAALWFYQRRPFSPWLGGYGYEITTRRAAARRPGHAGRAPRGGRDRRRGPGLDRRHHHPVSVFALLCGVFALTYPVFAWLDVLQAPLQRQLFLGS